MIVDSHLHVWDRSRSSYTWLDGADPRLDRTMTLEAVRQDLLLLGVDRVVLVQADDSRSDTELMLETAVDPMVAGIVASIDVERPHVASADIDMLAGEPRVRGVRVLNHERPDPAWLLRPDVAESAALVSAAGLSFDVVAVTLAHLVAAIEFADSHPGLSIVLDHLGKPPIGGDHEQWTGWSELIRRLAEREHVVAKVSGLYSVEGGPTSSGGSVQMAVDTALDAFGPSRLMIGSDWPMGMAAATGDLAISASWVPLVSALDGLSPAERELVQGGTATRIYRLEHSS